MYLSYSFYYWRTSLEPWKHSHRPWTAFGRIHSASTGDKLQHLLVGFTGVRHITQREDLPQQYSKRPTGGAAAQQNQLSCCTVSLNFACSTDCSPCSWTPTAETAASPWSNCNWLRISEVISGLLHQKQQTFNYSHIVYKKKIHPPKKSDFRRSIKLFSAICCIFWHMWIMYFSFMMDNLCALIPCISLACEDALHECLWWHPFDWQHRTPTFPVIAGSVAKILKKAIIYLSEPPLPFCWFYRPVNISCHAKVTNFGNPLWSRTGEQAISSSNIPGGKRSLSEDASLQ